MAWAVVPAAVESPVIWVAEAEAEATHIAANGKTAGGITQMVHGAIHIQEAGNRIQSDGGSRTKADGIRLTPG